jgi:hypothetical protein
MAIPPPSSPLHPRDRFGEESPARLGFGRIPRWLLIGGVGIADDDKSLGTRGSIRRWRARPHDQPLHGGGTARERRRGKGGKKGRRKG